MLNKAALKTVQQTYAKIRYQTWLARIQYSRIMSLQPRNRIGEATIVYAENLVKGLSDRCERGPDGNDPGWGGSRAD